MVPNMSKTDTIFVHILVHSKQLELAMLQLLRIILIFYS